MKHLKMLGLLVVAAASLMAFVSSASAAPLLTGPNAGEEFTGELKSSATETLTLKASVFTATCTVSEVNGTVSVNNSTEASGAISKLHFTSCDSNVKTIKNGSLQLKEFENEKHEIEYEVRASGNEVTVEKIGVSCIYGGGTGTKIGTFDPGTTATLTVSASLPKQAGSGALCAANGAWTGKYTVTSPDTLLAT